MERWHPVYLVQHKPQITARIQEIPCDFDKYGCRIVFILTPWYLSFYLGNEIQTRNHLKHGSLVLLLEKDIISIQDFYPASLKEHAIQTTSWVGPGVTNRVGKGSKKNNRKGRLPCNSISFPFSGQKIQK